MSREDVMHLAKEADVYVRGHYDEPGLTPEELERFANLVEAQQSDRYKALAGELAEALDTLTAIVGLTAFKYEAQRAVLQEALDAGRAALAKYDSSLKEQQEKGV